MSWKPEMLVEGEWHRNSLCFPTEWEAAKYGRSLMDRWLNVMDRRVVEIEGLPANYHYVDGALEQVTYTPIEDAK
jgi:hypothetical protein